MVPAKSMSEYSKYRSILCSSGDNLDKIGSVRAQQEQFNTSLIAGTNPFRSKSNANFVINKAVARVDNQGSGKNMDKLMFKIDKLKNDKKIYDLEKQIKKTEWM